MVQKSSKYKSGGTISISLSLSFGSLSSMKAKNEEIKSAEADLKAAIISTTATIRMPIAGTPPCPISLKKRKLPWRR